MSAPPLALGLVLIVALLAPGASLAQPAVSPAAPASPAAPGAMLLVENTGQWPEAARFQVWNSPLGPGTTWLAEDGIWLVVAGGKSQVAGGKWQVAGSEGRADPLADLPPANMPPATLHALRLTFPGSNPDVRIEPFGAMTTTVSYFIGNDPAQWRPDVPVWGGVRYVDLYPGVDLVLGGRDGGWQLEGGPGAETALVHLQIEGAEILDSDRATVRLAVEAETLEIALPKAPFTYQVNGVSPLSDVVALEVRPPGDALRQAVAPGDSPGDLIYGTFLGGGEYDHCYAIAVDATGSAYLTGKTASSDFPSTPGAFDPSYNGGYGDVFVVKLNPTGSGLAYATFLGGSSFDSGTGIAVDGEGSVYVAGQTCSDDFPTTPTAFDPSYNGDYISSDAIAVKLNPTGSELAYATFLGGSSIDLGYAIAVDGTGSAFVTGWTRSSDFPTTPGAFDTGLNGRDDIFVARFSPDGSELVYATFLGGNDFDYDPAIAVDQTGVAYVTGCTQSSDFPSTPGSFDPSFNLGGSDAFLVKLNPAGRGLAYATFLGGSGAELGSAVTIDGIGGVYVAGRTGFSDFPTTPGAFDTSSNGGGDGFVVKLDIHVDYNPDVVALIEQPNAGAFVAGMVTLSGFAIDLADPTGTGIDAVRVYVDGPADVGALIGDATYGLDRPDIAAQYGARFGPSGWELAWNTRGVAPGAHQLYGYARRSNDRVWSQLPLHAVNLAMAVPGEGYWADGYDVGMGVYDYIDALAVDNDSHAIYAAGDFSKIGGVNANRIARWDQATSSWSPLGSGLGQAYPDDFVTTLALDDAGNLYAGGAFTMAGGINAYHIAKWDGAAWSALGYGVGGGWPGRGVRALAVDNTSHSVYVGGPFTEAGGIIVNHIARWNEATSSWSPLGSGMNGPVNALALDSSGNLYAGGQFTTAGGVSAGCVAKWNPATQSWSALGDDAGLWGEIETLAVDRDGVVYAAGSYFPAGNIGVPAVLKWDGTAWSLLGDSFGDGFMNTLALDGAGTLYAAGQDQFHAICVTRWDPETGSWLTIGNSEAGYPAYPLMRALTLDGANNLYAAGRFTTIGAVAAQSVALWNPLTSSWSSLDRGGAGNGLDSRVFALALDEANAALYAGGLFFTAGDVVANGIARWDQATLSWSPLGSGMGGVNDAKVSALALSHDGILYVGGYFTTAGGVNASNIARWDPASSSWSPLGSGMNGIVCALALDDAGNLYAGGYFTTAGGVSANKIARWDGAAWSALGSGLTGYYPFVSALAVDSAGNVYAGGKFSYAGGVEAKSIARWDRATASWSALGSGVVGVQPPPWDGYYVTVNALAVDDVRGTVYAGGDFLTAGGVRANAVAKWNPTTSTWAALSGSMNGADEPAVHALALDSAGNLYVAGGWFDVVGGVSANGFARWNPATESWTVLRSDGGILALALDEAGPAVYAGGVFTTAGGKESCYIGQWHPGQKRYLPLVARGATTRQRYLPLIMRR